MSHCPVGIGTAAPLQRSRATIGPFLPTRPAVRLGKLIRARITSAAASTWPLTPLLQAAPKLANAAPAAIEPPVLERAGDLSDRLLQDYLSVWTSQYTEYDYYVPPEAVYGTLPEDLKGTLFLIGPGLTEVYGTAVRHPSDADGMVCSLAFGDGGRIFFRNRYVRTPSFVAEQALGRRISRGLHDRGAPTPAAQQQHQQLQSPTQQQHHFRQQQQQQHAGNAGRTGQQHLQQQEDLWEGEEAPKSTGGGGGAMHAKAGVLGTAGQLAAAAAAGAAAAGSDGKRPLRLLDPLALLGLPPLPPLSSLFNPLDTNFRAPANANIVFWGGRLLAFTEGGALPYELHKLSLETVGPYDACGAMADIGRIVAGYKIATAPQPQPTAAKGTGCIGGAASGLQQGHQDQRQGQQQQQQQQQQQRLVLMGAAQSGPDAMLRWVELREDGALAAPATNYRLPDAAAAGVRDFWVTERYYVAVQAPLDFNPQRFATRATIGAASFAECFDWDRSRPSRIYLVPRPQSSAAGAIAAAAATAAPHRSVTTTAAAAAATAEGAGKGSSIRGTHVVWPPKGPEAIVLDGPPLLPTSCVACYSMGADGQVLVLDGLCQQGLSGSFGGTLDSRDPEDHRHQPKPELTRLVVDLQSRTATARVLSQRTTAAAAPAAAAAMATTAPASFAGSTATASAGATATAAAMATATSATTGCGSGRSVGAAGSSSSYRRVYYAAASASETAEGWAPPQVVMKLSAPSLYGVPASALASCRTNSALSARSGSTAAATGAAAADGRAATDGAVMAGSAGSRMSRRRGTGAKVWTPGDRVFVGPPVFVPKAAQGAAAERRQGNETAAAGNAVSDTAGTTPLPPLESEMERSGVQPLSQATAVKEKSAVAAAGGAGRQEEEEEGKQEQEGWLLVLVHDAETMQAELCVLDAQNVTHGPVAIVALPHHLPHMRAAHFTRAYCGPGSAAPPGWRPRTAAAAPTAK